MKLFPTGSTKYYHSMYFEHLLKLTMPVNLKRWHRSYVDHCWDRNILRKVHEQSVSEAERKFEHLGEDKMKRLYWDELHSLCKQLGHKVTTRDRKNALFSILTDHMIKRCANLRRTSNPLRGKVIDVGNEKLKWLKLIVLQIMNHLYGHRKD